MATNPYLADQANAITGQVNRNLTQNILPQVGSGAVAAGGYGGSRQGVAEGLAITGANQDLSNSLANLYQTQYNTDQGLGLQQQALNNQYNLGLGNLGLGNQQQLFNFYTQNRGLDQSGAALGANLYNQGNLGLVGQGQGVYGLGTTQQQAPWLPYQNASNMFSQYSGLGGSQTQTANGSALGGAIGGGLAGAQIGNNLGLGTVPYQSPYAGQGISQPSVNYGQLENNTYGGG